MLMAGVVLLGCGDDPTEPEPLPIQITVDMRDNTFQPRTDTIAVGGTVTWRNVGNNSHTSSADAGTWTSGSVTSGNTYARQFGQAGSFPYFCEFHGSAGGNGMAGTIVVQAQ
jgi:plastocyanin